MFSFFHRTPKINVDCFTYDKLTYDFTPIVKSTKVYPDWWKELPNYEAGLQKREDGFYEKFDVQNLKNCYAFLEFFKKSITIPNWTDFYIETSYDYYKWYSAKTDDMFDAIEEHGKKQIGKGFKNYHHLKLISPWAISEKTNIQFSWVGFEWHLEDYNFKILPGVINFKVNHATNVNIMVPKVKKEFLLPAGTPLVAIIPLTEKKVILKKHLISKDEYILLMKNPNRNYINGWRTVEKLLKKQNKCPFGFGDNDE
jgi:hypothetical protein